MPNSTDSFHKITFRLQQDEDGYPPVSFESLWGIKKGQTSYLVDNTPYYIYGLSKGDLIDAREENNELMATRIVSQGGHSTLRVYAEHQDEKRAIIQRLEQSGARCHVTRGLSLFAVDIPPNADFQAMDAYLESLVNDETVAYEDACLQHEGPDDARRAQCESLASLQRLSH